MCFDLAVFEDLGLESKGAAVPDERQTMQLIFEVGRFFDEALRAVDSSDHAMFCTVSPLHALELDGLTILFFFPLGVRGLVASRSSGHGQVRAGYLPECLESVDGQRLCEFPSVNYSLDLKVWQADQDGGD